MLPFCLGATLVVLGDVNHELPPDGPPLVVGLCGVGVDGLEVCDMGLEKFLARSASSSVTPDSLFAFWPLPAAGILYRSTLATLEPLPPLPGVGESTRVGGSMLLDRVCFKGRAGTGGASGGEFTIGLAPLRPGLGDLNVRSVMLPPLSLRCMPPLPGGPPRPTPLIALALPTEEPEPRRIMRFVWILPTGSGDVVCERKAAAAAEEERDVADCGLRKKADAAATAAEEFALLLLGYKN